MMSVIGSDFLFWSALHVARGPMIKTVLATPPDLLTGASPAEQARVKATLTAVLPISARADGLRSDTAISKYLTPVPLKSIRAKTLIINARDDGHGTYASVKYAAGQIAGAKCIDFAQGGHSWVGHDDAVPAAITALLVPVDAGAGP